MSDSVLSAESITKTFPDGTSALCDFSCHFRAREFSALVGPSGSGKSTLLLCLAGILRPDSGAVRFGDQELSHLSGSASARLRRESFGFVFQLGMLVGEMDAIKNVALPLLMKGWDIRRAEFEALQCLESLGVSGMAHKRPGEVSVGEAQRIAVARALVGRPAVVFADEPTGSLDSSNGEDVFCALRTAADHGATVIMVTHNHELAARTDRIYALRDGRLV